MINKKRKENYSLENNVSIVLEAIIWLYLQLELKGLHHMQNPLYSHIPCYLHLNLIIIKKRFSFEYQIHLLLYFTTKEAGRPQQHSL